MADVVLWRPGHKNAMRSHLVLFGLQSPSLKKLQLPKWRDHVERPVAGVLAASPVEVQAYGPHRSLDMDM